MHSLLLYYKSMIMQVKTSHSYRFNYFLTIFTVIFHYMVQLLALWITLNYFDSIGGWSIYEVSFMYGLFTLSYGIMIFFFAGFRDFSSLIHHGSFDILLIRPHNLLLQVICGKLELTSIAHFGVASLLFWWCFEHIELTWSLFKVLQFIEILVAGALIQGGLLLLWAALSFWLVNTSALVRFGWVINANFLSYPLSLYNKPVQWAFTAFPLSFITYYPAKWFLDKSDTMAPWTASIGSMSLIIGILFFIVVYILWLLGIRSYKSTGN